MRYIGGDFAQCDLARCLRKGNDTFDFFLTSSEYKPMYFETASDGLAAMIDEITKDSSAEIFFPDNYCRQTIKVILGKATNKNVTVTFYDQLKSLLKLQNKQDSIKILLIMHFNSVFDQEAIRSFEELDSRFVLIEDFVQHPLEISKRKGKYSINSLRKILPLDVAVCYGLTSKDNYIQDPSDYYKLKRKAERKKTEFLINTSNTDHEKQYLKLFKEAELSLVNDKIYLAQNLDVEILKTIDFEEILTKRRKNYKFLYSKLIGLSDIEILPGDYFQMMILTGAQQKIKVKLAEQGIFTSIHWLDSQTEISRNELSIPIDHRYDLEDMNRIFNTLSKILIG